MVSSALHATVQLDGEKVSSKDFEMVGNPFLIESNKVFVKKIVIGDDQAKKKKEKKKKKYAAIQFGRELIKSAKEYTQNTTLHGLRYICADDLQLIERLFWVASFICAMIAAIYFITLLYHRWSDKPMIITMSPVATSIKTIPFPSITLCNMNGAMKDVAEKIVSNEKNDSHTFFEKYMLKEVCGERTYNPVSPLDALDIEWAQIEEFLFRVSQPCNLMTIYCNWRGKTVACSDLFSTELTDSGMCCTFNQVEKKFIFRNYNKMIMQGVNFTYSKSAINWTPENGYPDDAPEDVYPYRAIGAGPTMGLTVVLDTALHDYYCSSTASGGFKMVLHTPIETPEISENAYYLSPGYETRVGIRPKISSSTSSVLTIPQPKRQCYFARERYLKFFKTYTQKNCELECQSNLTNLHCKCIPFYLPKDNQTRICGTKDMECVLKMKDIYGHTIHENEREINSKDCLEHCACLPGCVEVQYKKHMSSGRLQDVFIPRPNFINYKNMTYSRKNLVVLHFFFIEKNFMPFEKAEIFVFTDLLSNIGGLLGLFLGFSFMSAAEILYFISLRLFCKKRKESNNNNKHNKKPDFPWPLLE